MKSRQVWTAAIVTLGCKLNQAESYRLHQDLTAAGVEVRPFGEPVDLCVVNTCTVTQVADQQARQLLRRAARFSPGGFIVAVGCYAQVSPQEVAAVAGVDLVIASKGRLLEQLATSGLTPGGTHGAGLNANSGPGPRRPLPETRVRQFVKLQDGCDDYCTYCIVPFARGHSASRPADAIVAEVRRLVGRGCCEVVLTGVQIGAYGRDRYRLGAADLPLPGAPLAALVHRLLAETEIGRIRISSIQPQDWTDDFLDLFSNPRLCPHLHLPLQSGADVTLRRMARRYRSGDFARLVERIRGAIPDVALTADMIVGFPGESEEDHLESLSFATTMEFADAHVFRYSPRRGTAASRMADQIRPEVKQRRAEELRTAIAESATRFREHFLGTRARVLWEEELQPVQGPRRWTGLTGNYLRVESSSSSDLLGHETEVTLGRLDGESFVAAPAVMEVG